MIETNYEIIRLHCTLKISTQKHHVRTSVALCLRLSAGISRILQHTSNNHCSEIDELRLERDHLI